jgi:hypothetical protein
MVQKELELNPPLSVAPVLQPGAADGFWFSRVVQLTCGYLEARQVSRYLFVRTNQMDVARDSRYLSNALNGKTTFTTTLAPPMTWGAERPCDPAQGSNIRLD